MARGLWFMVYGLWFMVYGSWFMVYGTSSFLLLSSSRWREEERVKQGKGRRDLLRVSIHLEVSMPCEVAGFLDSHLFRGGERGNRTHHRKLPLLA